MMSSMTNSLVGDYQVTVVDIDEGVLEGSNMSGTHLNGKNHKDRRTLKYQIFHTPSTSAI